MIKKIRKSKIMSGSVFLKNLRVFTGNTLPKRIFHNIFFAIASAVADLAAAVASGFLRQKP